MFSSLPHTFNAYDVPADVRVLLLLRKSMEKGLVRTLGDIYLVLKGIVVKSPDKLGPFTRAFYDYFLGMDIALGESLEDAVLRSKAFAEWKTDFLSEDPERGAMDMSAVADRFLDEVHLTTYDIRNLIDGQDILEKDDPDRADDRAQAGSDATQRLQDAADYSGVSLEELLRRMEKVAQQQKSKHSGGSHWIGTGGISPYGHSGAARGGIRVGGHGGGGMARTVIDDPQFYPVDRDQELNDDNTDAALAALKGVFETSATTSLDVPVTIKKGLERGGLFLPEEKEIFQEKMQVMLMIDNGGYSMDPHIRVVSELFRKMKTRFAHDMETFYFHNTVHGYLYADERRTERVSVESLLSHDPNYTVFIIGDAAMAPYELNPGSLRHWQDFRKKFKKIAWLNPDPKGSWTYSYTAVMISKIFPMYPLTPRGIEEAVVDMNKIRLR